MYVCIICNTYTKTRYLKNIYQHYTSNLHKAYITTPEHEHQSVRSSPHIFTIHMNRIDQFEKEGASIILQHIYISYTYEYVYMARDNIIRELSAIPHHTWNVCVWVSAVVFLCRSFWKLYISFIQRPIVNTKQRIHTHKQKSCSQKKCYLGNSTKEYRRSAFLNYTCAMITNMSDIINDGV